MKWSLKLLFTIVVLILVLFRQHDDFRGGRGFRFGSGGGHHGPITVVDFAMVFLLILIFYYNR